jgi:hypothetical protein
VAVSCPREGYFPVVRGPLNTPIKTLTEVLFLRRAASADRLPDEDSRVDPGLATTARISGIISTQAPPCQAFNFPKSARCAVEAISAQNHLRAGIGRGQDGRYCESYYLENVRSLYPEEFCGADVENGFKVSPPLPSS